MIQISNPVVAKLTDTIFTVAVIVTYTDDTTQEVLGTKSINANIPKGADAPSLLQPLIDKATDELLKEYDDICQFKTQFDGFKESVDSAIAAKILKKIGG